MSAQDDRDYDEEPRIYSPKRIVNPWRITVLGLPNGEIAYNFYSLSTDFVFTNGLVGVVRGMREIGKESVRKALEVEPYFLGLLEEDQKLLRNARMGLLRELRSRKAEF
ncbi:MAG: hypothetical protein Q7R87_01340 [Nanoarchaeota archaeon]|nr:hypothetical protein [Nanoarchaeota archaeon]